MARSSNREQLTTFLSVFGPYSSHPLSTGLPSYEQSIVHPTGTSADGSPIIELVRSCLEIPPPYEEAIKPKSNEDMMNNASQHSSSMPIHSISLAVDQSTAAATAHPTSEEPSNRKRLAPSPWSLYQNVVFALFVLLQKHLTNSVCLSVSRCSSADLFFNLLATDGEREEENPHELWRGFLDWLSFCCIFSSIFSLHCMSSLEVFSLVISIFHDVLFVPVFTNLSPPTSRAKASNWRCRRPLR